MRLKENFEKEYEIINCYAIPNKPLSYKGDLKNIKYEDAIRGVTLSDVESLYNEIENHKQYAGMSDDFYESTKSI